MIRRGAALPNARRRAWRISCSAAGAALGFKDTRMQIACHEQFPNALLGQKRIDDEPGGGRDEDAKHPVCCNRAGRKTIILFSALRLGQGDAAHCDRRGDGRPRHRRKACATHDGS